MNQTQGIEISCDFMRDAFVHSFIALLPRQAARVVEEVANFYA